MSQPAAAGQESGLRAQPNWRALRVLSVFRFALGIMLVVLVVFGGHVDVIDPAGSPVLFAGVAITYLVFSVIWIALARGVPKGFDLQLSLQVAADLMLLALLMHAAGGPRSGVGLLLVAAVGGASVISTALRSAFTAAIATLFVLGDAVLQTSRVGWADFGQLTPAAMLGGACFAIGLLVNRLAIRLEAQEALAEQRGEDLHAQLLINRLVISELEQGVIVLDSQGRVRAMNRAARDLVGDSDQQPQLTELVRSWPEPGHDTTDNAMELSLSCVDHSVPSGTAQRPVRVRLLRPPDEKRRDSVLILEDLRFIEERAQQLKLASMGRLSASIAHEIRNPLAAIRHANELLGERLTDSLTQRLSGIVEDSSVRIDRIVEDVLSIARRERPSPERIDAATFLKEVIADLVTATGADSKRVELSPSREEPIVFDPRHLRQVLVNLLTNALRYGSERPGALRLEWGSGRGGQLELKVLDDGPGLPADMLQHVFEPFVTTEIRGTGLGLYLAREFCDANEASIRYERISDGGRYSGAFVITPRVG